MVSAVIGIDESSVEKGFLQIVDCSKPEIDVVIIKPEIIRRRITFKRYQR